LPKNSPLYSADPLVLRGVISLAGISDLRQVAARRVCGNAIEELLGGTPAAVPERYQQGSPIDLLPLGVPTRLIHGALDSIVPLSFAQEHEAQARQAGDDVRLLALPEVGHFELIAPQSAAWPVVRDTVLDLLGKR
jgi:pimeloyl-ACP methyl ester carboxylesterase